MIELSRLSPQEKTADLIGEGMMVLIQEEREELHSHLINATNAKVLDIGQEIAKRDKSEEADLEIDTWIEVETDTIRTEILIEEKEDASIAEKKVIKLETADKRDIPMVEETEDQDIEGQDQDHPAMKDTVEEEITIEVAEIEATKIKEEEGEIEEAEMIIEDIHLTAEVGVMIAEEMEREIKEITEIKITAEEETLDQIQDMSKKEDPEIIDTAVKKEKMDLKNQ